MRSFCNWESPATSQSIGPPPFGHHDRPDPPGSRRRRCSGPPRPSLGRPATPGGPRSAARSPPRTRARSRTDSRPRTRAQLRPRTPLRTRLARSGERGQVLEGASSGWAAAAAGHVTGSPRRRPRGGCARPARRAPPVGAAGEAAWSILALVHSGPWDVGRGPRSEHLSWNIRSGEWSSDAATLPSGVGEGATRTGEQPPAAVGLPGSSPGRPRGTPRLSPQPARRAQVFSNEMVKIANVWKQL